MRRTVSAGIAVVFGVAAVVLFVIGVTHGAGGPAHGVAAYHAIQVTFTLVLIAAACACVTFVAVGTRR